MVLLAARVVLGGWSGVDRRLDQVDVVVSMGVEEEVVRRVGDGGSGGARW